VADDKKLAAELSAKGDNCLGNPDGNQLSAIWLSAENHVTAHGAKPDLKVDVEIRTKKVDPKTGKGAFATKPTRATFERNVPDAVTVTEKNPDTGKLSSVFKNVFGSMLAVGLATVRVLKLDGAWESALSALAKTSWGEYLKIPKRK
jgi:hypothetical protein